jgi:hypothetical protein
LNLRRSCGWREAACGMRVAPDARGRPFDERKSLEVVDAKGRKTAEKSVQVLCL